MLTLCRTAARACRLLACKATVRDCIEFVQPVDREKLPYLAATCHFLAHCPRALLPEASTFHRLVSKCALPVA